MAINKKIAVYCASSTGNDEIYLKQAALLGRTLAANGIGLVYGGGKAGLMGAVADAVLKSGGEAIGVIPTFLKDLELAHRALTEIHFVETMHERKAKMFDLADAFITMPGSYGTLEELAEILAWAKLGLHKKPAGLLNINGFYDPLLSLIQNMVSAGLLENEKRIPLIISQNAQELVNMVKTHLP